MGFVQFLNSQFAIPKSEIPKLLQLVDRLPEFINNFLILRAVDPVGVQFEEKAGRGRGDFMVLVGQLSEHFVSLHGTGEALMHHFAARANLEIIFNKCAGAVAD